MNREEVGLGSHSPSRSSPVPDKPYGFSGFHKTEKEVSELRSCVNREVGLGSHFPSHLPLRL